MLHNTVMLTLATEGYVPFVLNLHASLERIGLGRQLVAYTLDDASHRTLSGCGVACHRFRSAPGPKWNDWKTLGFKEIMRAKYVAALGILETSRNVLFVDSDIVLLKNPADHIQDVVSRTSAHLVMQSQAPLNYNAGFWFATPAAPVMDLFSQIASDLEESAEWTCDQRLLNERVPRVPGLRIHGLDPMLFACGNQFLKDKRRQPFDTGAAYLLHFNFIVGMETKVSAMQEHGVVFHQELVRYGPSLRRTVVRRARLIRGALAGRPVRRWPSLISELFVARHARRHRKTG